MSRKADIKASLRGIARALHNFMGTGSEERLPEKTSHALGAINEVKPPR
jgi:hypothetical protein